MTVPSRLTSTDVPSVGKVQARETVEPSAEQARSTGVEGTFTEQSTVSLTLEAPASAVMS